MSSIASAMLRYKQLYPTRDDCVSVHGTHHIEKITIFQINKWNSLCKFNQTSTYILFMHLLIPLLCPESIDLTTF